MPQSNLYTIEEIAKRLSVSKPTISRWCKELALEPADKERNRYYYDDEAVQALGTMAQLVHGEGKTLEDAARLINGEAAPPDSAVREATERVLGTLDGHMAMLEMIYKAVQHQTQNATRYTTEIARESVELGKQVIALQEECEALKRENMELRAALEERGLFGRIFRAKPASPSLLGLNGGSL